MRPTVPTFFLDTQALIYAFEKEDPLWRNFVEARLLSGHRLVLSENHLYEFGRSVDLPTALSLIEKALGTNPLWIRPFLAIEADEVIAFAKAVPAKQGVPSVTALSEDFHTASVLARRHGLDPGKFVAYAVQEKARGGIARIAESHAEALNYLSRAEASGSMSPALRAIADRAILQSRLSRQGAEGIPLQGAELEAALKVCLKHQKWLMRACPSFATEFHLATFRTASPRRIARPSDSMDLMLATAAFPYVGEFVTNDGYLHGALTFVKKRCPSIVTSLVRRPDASCVAHSQA